MLNSFEWNGISFRDFETPAIRLIVRKSPVINRPARKYDRYSVSGRNGDIFIPQDAYDNYVQPYELFMYTTEKGDDLNEFSAHVANWLYAPKGYAKLVDDHEADWFRMAYFTGPFNVENDLTVFGKASVSFNCRPERFLDTGDIVRTVNSSNLNLGWYEIKNPSLQTAKPIITTQLYVPNTVSSPYVKVKIQVQNTEFGTKQWIYTVQSSSAYASGKVHELTVDSDKRMWMADTEPYAGKYVTGSFDYPELPPGESNIRITALNASGEELSSNQYPVWTIKPRWWEL